MDALRTLGETPPQAYAFVYGSSMYPSIIGAVYFYPFLNGSLVLASISGLPFRIEKCQERVFGFHIHEGSVCSGTTQDPFAQTKTHYNPNHCDHPAHAGDLPALFGNHGYALEIFYTERFLPTEVIGKTVVIHDMPDDYKTQPSGGSGEKIACGEIQDNRM